MMPRMIPTTPKIPSTPNSIRLKIPKTSDAIANGLRCCVQRAYSWARWFVRSVSRPKSAIMSREIVNENFFPMLSMLCQKLLMQRMILIRIMRGKIVEDDAEGDIVTVVYDGARRVGGLALENMTNQRNFFQKFL